MKARLWLAFLFLTACNSEKTLPGGAAGEPGAEARAGAGAAAAASGGVAGMLAGGGGAGRGAAGTAHATGGAGASSSSGTGGSSGAAGAANGGAGSSGPPAAGSGAAGASAAGSGGQAGSGQASTGTSGCDGALFCDSFESEGAAPNPARWEIVTPNCMGDAAVELDSTIARAGMRSARVRSAGGYCNHIFLQAKASGPLPDPLFARFYVRFDKPLTAAHVTFLAMKDGTDGKDLRMGGQSEILMWNRESDDATLPELSPSGIALSRKPTAQTWLCVELEVDSQQRELHTWVDGQMVAGLTVEGDGTPDIDAQWRRNTNWQPKPQNLKLGWESYGADANTIWFDDVALGSQRIGCDR